MAEASRAGPARTGIRRRGVMLVLSSPSGAGKTSIARALIAREPALSFSVSVTTRRPRPGERDGVDYVFVDEARFQRMIADGALLEHAIVFGHAYGTPREPVETALGAGRDVLFDIDWQGTQQLVERAPSDLVSVFVLPPSTAELERRLYARGQDSATVIAGRMARALDEITHWSEYEYSVVNTDFDVSVAAVQAILAAERLKRARQLGLAEFVNTLRRGR